MSNNSKEKYLSDEEVNALIKRIKYDGDNDAWDTLYKNYKKYVWSRVNELLDQAKYAESASWLSAKNTKIDLSWISNEELFQCGWMGFLDSLRAYKPEKGEFTTYATWYIDGEIKKGISKEFNPLGLTDKPTKGAGKYVGVVRFYDECGMVDPYIEAMTAVEDERIWHYRVDLMSDVEIRLDENGKKIPMRVSKFEGLPIHNIHWDPEKYMAEHMNMGFDEPRDILIKILNDRYTMLHDWFGDHYQKTVKECEEGYDIVQVRCSPFMMVHWAMQYGDAVEVMDKELREQIREEAERMVERYG